MNPVISNGERDFAEETRVPGRQRHGVERHSRRASASVEVRPSEKNPEEIIVTGPCPRCSDLTMHVEPVIVFSGLVGDAGRAGQGRHPGSDDPGGGGGPGKGRRGDLRAWHNPRRRTGRKSRPRGFLGSGR